MREYIYIFFGGGITKGFFRGDKGETQKGTERATPTRCTSPIPSPGPESHITTTHTHTLPSRDMLPEIIQNSGTCVRVIVNGPAFHNYVE